MDISDIKASLHPLERKVFPNLLSCDSLSSLAKRSGVKDVEAMRALQWLSNKNLIKLSTSAVQLIELDDNGKLYFKIGFPEKKLAKILFKKDMNLNDLREKSGFDRAEFNISLGSLKKKAAVNIVGGFVKLTDAGKLFLNKNSLEEKFVLTLKFPRKLQSLNVEEKSALDSLKKRRKVVKISSSKSWSWKLSSIGKAIFDEGLGDDEFIDRLTSEMLKSGSWKNKKFRRYDVKINVPKISGGKRHFVSQAVDFARRIWLDMGFEEMEGSMVQTSFWTFDALFTAQDHPVREMQDTFFIENPEKGKLPSDEIVTKVKEAHEKGIGGSTGWGYKWDPEEAKRNVLRTHTTVLSAQTLASLKDVKNGKFFAVGRNFRNETLDWSHHFEFNQTEGIVIDPNANFRNLLGYLKEFFSKMGYPEARFRPAFFSYTEPSVEIDIFHPVHKKWVEFGGAGIFRPEVVIALLGEDIPVLAWGPGFDRIYLEYFDVKDIRDIYKNDIKNLRESKFWMK